MATKYHIHLSKEDRRELEALIRSGESSARTQTCARILLLTDESQKQKKRTKEIASALLCSLPAITTLATEVAAWEKDRNNLKVHIHWQFTSDNARIKLKRLSPVTVIK